jgi:hypothetical protein
MRPSRSSLLVALVACGRGPLPAAPTPRLEDVQTSLVVTANHDLELIDIAKLHAIGHGLVLVDNGELALVEAGRLMRVGAVRVEDNRALPADLVEALRARQSK